MVKQWLLAASFLAWCAGAGMAAPAKLLKKSEAIQDLMAERQWEKAMTSLLELRELQQKEDAKPWRLAAVDYQLGVCQLQLATKQMGMKREEEAMQLYQASLKSFESCRAVPDDQGNGYYAMAILRIGLVYQGQREYGKALINYDEFLLRRNQLRDAYDQASFTENVIICHVLKPVPDLRLAAEKLEELIDKRAFWRVSDKVLLRCLSVYAEKALELRDLEPMKRWLGEGKIKLEKDAKWSELARVVGLSSLALKVGESEVASSLLQILPADQSYLSLEEQGQIKNAKLAVTFQLKEYAQVISAVRAMDRVSEGIMFMAATSAFYLNDEQEYQHWYQRYQQEFPDGESQIDLQYYWAVLQVSESRWKLAGDLFADLLKNEELDPELRIAASYQLASIDYSLAKYDQALEKLEGISESKVMDDRQRFEVLLLTGQTREITRQRDLAKVAYENALQIAEKVNDPELVAESLFYLVSFHGREKISGDTNTDLASAIPYYERFMDKYAGSVYAAQTITAAMPAMVSAGMGEEIFKTAKAKIDELQGTKDAPGLEALVSTYLWEMLGSGEKLSELTEKFLHKDTASVVMVYGLLGVYEVGLSQANSSLGRTVYYQGMKLKLQAWLYEKSSSQGFPAYVAAGLARKSIESHSKMSAVAGLLDHVSSASLLSTRQSAAVSRAVILRQGAREADSKISLEMLRQVVSQQPGDRSIFEYAYSELAEGLVQMKQWEELSSVAKAYLDNQNFTSDRAMMSACLGLSYDKRGMIEDAISHYNGVFVSHTGDLDASAPAVARLIQLTWQRNSPARGKVPSDRQTAYHLGHRYLALVQGSYVEGVLPSQTRASLAEISKLVNKWEKSGEVVSVEQMLKEARQGKRAIP